MTIDELYHHGILGQKWGKRNGPPYPLAPEKHSAAEKEAGWKVSIKKGPSIKYKGGTAGGGAAEPEEKEELEVVEYDKNDPDWDKLENHILDDPETIRKYRLYSNSEEFLIPHEDGTYALMLDDVKINIPKNTDVKSMGNRIKTLNDNLKTFREHGFRPSNAGYMKYVKQVINGIEPDFYSNVRNIKKDETMKRKGIEPR